MSIIQDIKLESYEKGRKFNIKKYLDSLTKGLEKQLTKSNKSTSYAISVDSAHKQAREAQELYNLAKSLLETYLCGDQPVRYRESAVRLLIDHSYNSKMYGETLRDYIETGERVKNKKTGKIEKDI